MRVTTGVRVGGGDLGAMRAGGSLGKYSIQTSCNGKRYASSCSPMRVAARRRNNHFSFGQLNAPRQKIFVTPIISCSKRLIVFS
jgi:hypothetical protein